MRNFIGANSLVLFTVHASMLQNESSSLAIDTNLAQVQKPDDYNLAQVSSQCETNRMSSYNKDGGYNGYGGQDGCSDYGGYNGYGRTCFLGKYDEFGDFSRKNPFIGYDQHDYGGPGPNQNHQAERKYRPGNDIFEMERASQQTFQELSGPQMKKKKQFNRLFVCDLGIGICKFKKIPAKIDLLATIPDHCQFDRATFNNLDGTRTVNKIVFCKNESYPGSGMQDVVVCNDDICQVKEISVDIDIMATLPDHCKFEIVPFPYYDGSVTDYFIVRCLSQEFMQEQERQTQHVQQMTAAAKFEQERERERKAQHVQQMAAAAKIEQERERERQAQHAQQMAAAFKIEQERERERQAQHVQQMAFASEIEQELERQTQHVQQMAAASEIKQGRERQTQHMQQMFPKPEFDFKSQMSSILEDMMPDQCEVQVVNNPDGTESDRKIVQCSNSLERANQRKFESEALQKPGSQDNVAPFTESRSYNEPAPYGGPAPYNEPASYGGPARHNEPAPYAGPAPYNEPATQNEEATKMITVCNETDCERKEISQYIEVVNAMPDHCSFKYVPVHNPNGSVTEEMIVRCSTEEGRKQIEPHQQEQSKKMHEPQTQEEKPAPGKRLVTICQDGDCKEHWVWNDSEIMDTMVDHCEREYVKKIVPDGSVINKEVIKCNSKENLKKLEKLEELKTPEPLVEDRKKAQDPNNPPKPEQVTMRNVKVCNDGVCQFREFASDVDLESTMPDYCEFEYVDVTNPDGTVTEQVVVNCDTPKDHQSEKQRMQTVRITQDGETEVKYFPHNVDVKSTMPDYCECEYVDVTNPDGTVTKEILVNCKTPKPQSPPGKKVAPQKKEKPSTQTVKIINDGLTKIKQLPASIDIKGTTPDHCEYKILPIINPDSTVSEEVVVKCKTPQPTMQTVKIIQDGVSKVKSVPSDIDIESTMPDHCEFDIEPVQNPNGSVTEEVVVNCITPKDPKSEKPEMQTVRIIQDGVSSIKQVPKGVDVMSTMPDPDHCQFKIVPVKNPDGTVTEEVVVRCNTPKTTEPEKPKISQASKTLKPNKPEMQTVRVIQDGVSTVKQIPKGVDVRSTMPNPDHCQIKVVPVKHPDGSVTEEIIVRCNTPKTTKPEKPKKSQASKTLKPKKPEMQTVRIIKDGVSTVKQVPKGVDVMSTMPDHAQFKVVPMKNPDGSITEELIIRVNTPRSSKPKKPKTSQASETLKPEKQEMQTVRIIKDGVSTVKQVPKGFDIMSTMPDHAQFKVVPMKNPDGSITEELVIRVNTPRPSIPKKPKTSQASETLKPEKQEMQTVRIIKDGVSTVKQIPKGFDIMSTMPDHAQFKVVPVKNPDGSVTEELVIRVNTPRPSKPQKPKTSQASKTLKPKKQEMQTVRIIKDGVSTVKQVPKGVDIMSTMPDNCQHKVVPVKNPDGSITEELVIRYNTPKPSKPEKKEMKNFTLIQDGVSQVKQVPIDVDIKSSMPDHCEFKIVPVKNPDGTVTEEFVVRCNSQKVKEKIQSEKGKNVPHMQRVKLIYDGVKMIKEIPASIDIENSLPGHCKFELVPIDNPDGTVTEEMVVRCVTPKKTHTMRSVRVCNDYGCEIKEIPSYVDIEEAMPDHCEYKIVPVTNPDGTVTEQIVVDCRTEPEPPKPFKITIIMDGVAQEKTVPSMDFLKENLPPYCQIKQVPKTNPDGTITKEVVVVCNTPGRQTTALVQKKPQKPQMQTVRSIRDVPSVNDNRKTMPDNTPGYTTQGLGATSTVKTYGGYTPYLPQATVDAPVKPVTVCNDGYCELKTVDKDLDIKESMPDSCKLVVVPIGNPDGSISAKTIVHCG